MPIYESKKVSENFRALRETWSPAGDQLQGRAVCTVFQQTLTVKMTDEL